jgi:hypothetical protein
MESYNFLHTGELLQEEMDVMVIACKRFGADKAEQAISEVCWGIREEHSDMNITDDVQYETKVEISPEDIQFVRKIVVAEDAIKYAVKSLKEARMLMASGKDGKNGE